MNYDSISTKKFNTTYENNTTGTGSISTHIFGNRIIDEKLDKSVCKKSCEMVNYIKTRFFKMWHFFNNQKNVNFLKEVSIRIFNVNVNSC